VLVAIVAGCCVRPRPHFMPPAITPLLHVAEEREEGRTERERSIPSGTAPELVPVGSLVRTPPCRPEQIFFFASEE
jgi:hypothetical protein